MVSCHCRSRTTSNDNSRQEQVSWQRRSQDQQQPPPQQHVAECSIVVIFRHGYQALPVADEGFAALAGLGTAGLPLTLEIATPNVFSNNNDLKSRSMSRKLVFSMCCPTPEGFKVVSIHLLAATLHGLRRAAKAWHL